MRLRVKLNSAAEPVDDRGVRENPFEGVELGRTRQRVNLPKPEGAHLPQSIFVTASAPAGVTVAR